MNDDPYVPPKAPILSEKLSPDFEERVFHPLHVLIATLLGHVFAAAYMISINDRTIGHPYRGSAITMASTVYTVLILREIHRVPSSVQLWLLVGAIPVTTLWAWLSLRRLLRGRLVFYSYGHALAVGLFSLIFQFLIFGFFALLK